MESARYDGNVAWFRGERDPTWQLRATIHRHVEHFVEGLADPPAETERVKLLRSEYKSVYLQHFSLPTRLLDWTESFACAVFFAQFGRDPKDAASIWVLDPSKLNKLGCGREALLMLGETRLARRC
jgi:hypothetical protein